MGERKIYNEELQSLFCAPNIVRAIKSRVLIWATHVIRMEKGVLSKFEQMNVQERELYKNDEGKY